ncbi:phosphotransferase [Psychrobacillus sp.]|uniref:phosphotransferase enzyme family protein n=1 Tax=Psychrobacillus sp. TaxID=1871623 RepID=UPI0028BD5972|nr:phosphotransferase [Psychrobacillus sp.]
MEENCIRLDGGFHNDVFHIKNKGKVVRISDAKKTKEMVLQEIEWMNFLYEEGVAVSKPEMTLESEEERVRACFEFIEGNQIDVTNQFHWNVNMFEQLGRIVGKMHALSKKFKVEGIHRPVWTVENPDVFGIRENLSPWIRENYEQLMQNLFSYEMSPETFGLIHNDFHQGNLIINGEGTLTTIDFDECSYNWYAQDIAVAFYHAYWQHNSNNGNVDTFPQTFMSHFFTGYKEENLLHKDIIKQIPIFLKLREIFLYKLFSEKWDMNNIAEWQKYTMHELEKKIKNEIPYAGISDFSVFL